MVSVIGEFGEEGRRKLAETTKDRQKKEEERKKKKEEEETGDFKLFIFSKQKQINK